MNTRSTCITLPSDSSLRLASLVAVVVCAALLGSVSIASADECPVVTPGQGIGPIKLGMKRADLDNLGLAIKPGPIETQLMVGPFTVYLYEDEVTAIGADSAEARCVRLGKTDSPLPATSLESLAAVAAAGCGPMQFNIGATLIDCREGLKLLQHMGGKEVRVVTAPNEPEQLCDAWVQPGGNVAAANAAADVGEKTRVCVEARVLTADLVPTDVSSIYGKMHISTCEVTEAIGATTLDCNYSGVRLIFAGPQLRLSRVESIALRQ